MRIHAVSVLPGDSQTVCGVPMGSGAVMTGFGREHQAVCPGVTCEDCHAAMGLSTSD